MSVRYSCVAWVIVVLAGTSTAARAQGLDIASRPLDGIEDLLVEEEELPEAAVQPSAPSDSAMAKLAMSPRLVLRRIPRNYVIQLGADLDDKKALRHLPGCVDVTPEISAGVQLRHTLKGGAASETMDQGGIYLSYHPVE